MIDWRQGEHLTLIGPTGCGKTTLATKLLPLRRYVAVMATKPRDPILATFKKMGYVVTREWPPRLPPEVAPRVVFWPKSETMDSIKKQVPQLRMALQDIYRQGGWTVYFDELRYVTDFLGLRQEVELLLLQGRALGVSVVSGAQRPAWLPLTVYDQATHLFLWRETDRRNLQRLAELGGVDSRKIMGILPKLSRHETLYVNTRDGTMYRTVPLL